MAAATLWQSFSWTRFGNPACDRALFRRVQRFRPVKIVEFGVGDLMRAQRVISLAQRVQPEETKPNRIEYCGVDLFDMRADVEPLKLKHAHNTLVQTGAKVRLVPGDLPSALARAANDLLNTDLLIVDATHSREDLEAVFHFLPRMLQATASIARYSQVEQQTRLRWMKPDSFVTPRRKRKAA